MEDGSGPSRLPSHDRLVDRSGHQIRGPSGQTSEVRASAWNSGKKHEPGAYGIKFTPNVRDRHFDRAWSEVIVELDGGATVNISLTDSFWRYCSELRSAEVGRWLLASGRAPWTSGQPPHIAVNLVEGNRFTARLMEHKSLL